MQKCRSRSHAHCMSGFSHHCTEYVDKQCRHRSRALLRGPPEHGDMRR